MNHGVIEGKLITDYIAGANSPIEYEIVNPSGNWTPYLPVKELQRNKNFDTYACVSYSALNCIETQLKYKYGVEYNFSDRFTAIMSHTVPNVGNYLWRVAESIRKEGVVLETDFPAPLNYTRDTYYIKKADIPQYLKEKGLRWLEEYSVNYEWIDVTRENLKKHLKQAPLQIVIPGHAIMQLVQENDVYRYFDHYVPFVKERTTLPTSALKIIVNKKNMKLTEKHVRFLQALEGFGSRPEDRQAVEYWAGKELDEYITARIPDKIFELEEVQNYE